MGTHFGGGGGGGGGRTHKTISIDMAANLGDRVSRVHPRVEFTPLT